MIRRTHFVTCVVMGLALLAASPAKAQTDMMNLASASISRSPSDVSTWRPTVTIDGLIISTAGIQINTSAPIPWPDTPDFSKVTPDGMGPLQYTVWVCVQPAAWKCAGFIQMWDTRAAENPMALPPLPSQWSLWWGPTAGGATNGVFDNYVPRPGDTIGIFVAAGDERGASNVTVVKERSNVVTFQLVSGDVQTLTFPSSGPAPAPQPAPVPTPTPTSTPTPTPTPGPGQPIVTWSRDIDLDAMDDDLKALKQALTQAQADLVALSVAQRGLGTRLSALESTPVRATCEASLFGIPIHCALK